MKMETKVSLLIGSGYVVATVLIIWFSLFMEIRTYDRLCDHRPSYWDAMWVEFDAGHCVTEK